MAELAVETVRLPLRAPLRTAWGTLAERELVRVRLRFGPGDAGDGEAAPLEPYDGVPLAAVAAALDAYAAVLRDAPAGAEPGELLAACAAERPLPQALAAIDLALWDRAGRLAGHPVARLLDARAAERVDVNATLTADDRAGAAAQAAAAAHAGFGCVKVKVGIGDDAGRVAAVRAAAGPEMAIRVDANGAWSVDEAVAAIGVLDLAAGGLEYVEQPSPSVEDLAAVRRKVAVPIAADESIRRAADPYRVRDLEAADIAVLKVQPLGGVRACLLIAEEIGLPVVVSSALETSVGIASGVALAAALPELPYACGLATVQLLTDDVVVSPLLPVDGVLPAVRPVVDAAALDRLAVSADQVAWWEARYAAVAALRQDRPT